MLLELLEEFEDEDELEEDAEPNSPGEIVVLEGTGVTVGLVKFVLPIVVVVRLVLGVVVGLVVALGEVVPKVPNVLVEPVVVFALEKVLRFPIGIVSEMGIAMPLSAFSSSIFTWCDVPEAST